MKLRNGYRLFDPVRGMDYIVDLLYRNNDGDKVHRIHLTRIISNNQLLQQVSYLFHPIYCVLEHYTLFIVVLYSLSFVQPKLFQRF